MQVVIIDDDPKAVKGLSNLLNEYCKNVLVKAASQTVEGGIKAISKYQPDVVFLDIEMNPGTGFDVLQAFPEPKFEVIFTTAYDEYAIKAIRYSALDYLIKPINVKDLIRSVEMGYKKKDERLRLEQYKLLQSGLFGKKLNRIAIPSAEELVFLDIKDIVYLHAENNYTYFNLSNGKRILVSTTLKDYENLLNDSFFRVHASFLINLAHIKKYVKGLGGYVVMNDGSSINVSARRKADFLKMIKKK